MYGLQYGEYPKFYDAISFSKERRKTDSKTQTTTVGNECLLGQIATFIENLHLSYDDVVYRIPYRNLQIMMKDKLHTIYGEVDHEVDSLEEYYRLTGRENPFKKKEEKPSETQ